VLNLYKVLTFET